MADYYCQSSAFMEVPEEKIPKALEIIERVTAEIKADNDDMCGCTAEPDRNIGIWFHHDDYFESGHAEQIARALIEELELNEPFYCSWACTCSKPLVDSFSGGAFVVQRGYETHWVDAQSYLQNFVSSGQLKKMVKHTGNNPDSR